MRDKAIDQQNNLRIVQNRLDEITDLKVGDTIIWKAHGEIKSKILKIAPSRFNTDIMFYHCRNGCQFQRKEILLYKLALVE